VHGVSSQHSVMRAMVSQLTILYNEGHGTSSCQNTGCASQHGTMMHGTNGCAPKQDVCRVTRGTARCLLLKWQAAISNGHCTPQHAAAALPLL
jgi:hypothetical protein